MEILDSAPVEFYLELVGDSMKPGYVRQLPLFLPQHEHLLPSQISYRLMASTRSRLLHGWYGMVRAR